MTRIAFRFVSVCAVLGCAYVLPASVCADPVEVTIGANVNQATTESGTCGFASSAERPCTIVTSAAGGSTMISPCSGTVTRFRLNGFPRPLNRYSLRVVRRNSDGTYTGTATSAPVQIETEGVNEYATDLPISTGELLGIDFLDSLEEHGLRWVGGAGVSAAVFFEFPADGTAAAPSIPPATFYYLFNADITCGSTTTPPPPPPTAAAPSNSFRVVSLKKQTLTLSLASAGTVSATEVARKKGAHAAKHAKRLLKPTHAAGGPGLTKLKLTLTGAAKAKLRKTGKVKVRANLTFTPTGGTAAVQVRSLTIRGRAANKHAAPQKRRP